MICFSSLLKNYIYITWMKMRKKYQYLQHFILLTDGNCSWSVFSFYPTVECCFSFLVKESYMPKWMEKTNGNCSWSVFSFYPIVECCFSLVRESYMPKWIEKTTEDENIMIFPLSVSFNIQTHLWEFSWHL